MTEVIAQSNGQSNGKVDLRGMRIDPTKLKLRELVEIERTIDRRVAGDLMTGILGADLMQALLWIALRRAHPQVTFEAAGEYDFDDIATIVTDDEPAEGDAVDPPPAPSGSENSDGMPAPATSSSLPVSVVSTG